MFFEVVSVALLFVDHTGTTIGAESTDCPLKITVVAFKKDAPRIIQRGGEGSRKVIGVAWAVNQGMASFVDTTVERVGILL
jgi:hypothetical protein